MSNSTERLQEVVEQATKVEFSEFTKDRLEAWQIPMGEEKFTRVTDNYSNRPDYVQEVKLA